MQKHWAAYKEDPERMKSSHKHFANLFLGLIFLTRSACFNTAEFFVGSREVGGGRWEGGRDEEPRGLIP